MKKKKEVNFDVIDTRPVGYLVTFLVIVGVILLFSSLESQEHPWGVVTTFWDLSGRSTCFHPELCFPEDVKLVVKDEEGNLFYYETTGRLMQTIEEFDSPTVIMQDANGRWRLMAFTIP